MKRINIVYGGQPYSIGDRDLDSVLAEISVGLQSEEPRWLTVNVGEGVPRSAHLLLVKGVDLALIPVPAIAEDSDEVSSEPPPPRAR